VTPWTTSVIYPGYEQRLNRHGHLETRPALLRAGFMEALIKRSEDAEQVLQDCGRIRFERTIRAAIELYLEENPPGGLREEA
jgi:hypothetical protein